MSPDNYSSIKDILSKLHQTYEINNLLNLPAYSENFCFDINEEIKYFFEIRPSQIARNEFALIVHLLAPPAKFYHNKHEDSEPVASFTRLEHMLNGGSLRNIGKVIRKLNQRRMK